MNDHGPTHPSDTGSSGGGAARANGIALPAAPPLGSFHVSRFDSETDNAPCTSVMTGDALARFVAEPLVRESKRGTPCWSPTRFEDGATRANRNAIEVGCAVFDLDRSTTIDEAVWRLENFYGCEAYIHSSHSHLADGATQKFRVIVPLTEPIPSELWTIAHERLRAQLFPESDASCSDVARLYFSPSHRPGAPYEHRILPGARLELPLEELRAEHARRQAERPPVAPIAPASITFERACALLEKLDPCDFADHGRWLELGMAFWHATGGSREGFLAFDAWSARDPLYDTETECESREARWSTWAPKRGEPAITVGTLIARAKEAAGAAAVAEILGPTSDEVHALLDAEPLPEPPAPEPVEPFRPINIAPYLDLARIKRRDVIVDSLLYPGFASIIAGAPGVGKSNFSLHIAASVASGRPFSYWTPRRRARVLVLSAEDPFEEVQARLFGICGAMGVAPEELGDRLDILALRGCVMIARQGSGTLETTDTYRRVLRTMREGRYEVLICDPLIKFSRGADESSNGDMEQVAELFMAIAATTRAAVSYIAHSRKGGDGDLDSVRGASSTTGNARCVVTVTRMRADVAKKLLPPGGDPLPYVGVACPKNNLGRMHGPRWLRLEPVPITRDDEVLTEVATFRQAKLGHEIEAAGADELQRDAILDVIEQAEAAGKPLSTRVRGKYEGRADYAIAQALGVSLLVAQRSILQLRQAGLLVAVPGAPSKPGREAPELLRVAPEASVAEWQT